MDCEHCNKELTIKYGSGRFCNKKCASAFSTKSKRSEINDKVSKRLKEKDTTDHLQTKEVRDKRNQTMIARYGTIGFVPRLRSKEEIDGSKEKYKQTRFNNRHARVFDQCSMIVKKKILIEEYGHQCMGCKLTEWIGAVIPLDIDHIDGNHDNNQKSNFRLLCPNCHALTPTYKGKNKQISKADVDNQKQQNGSPQK